VVAVAQRKIVTKPQHPVETAGPNTVLVSAVERVRAKARCWWSL
jgi:hypothetical protein